MLKMSMFVCTSGLLIGTLAAGVWLVVWPARAAGFEARDGKRAIKPVEGDMHEFMGHFFEPTFRRLRGSIASRPAGDAEWKRIASDALLLAEGGNLLLTRSTDEQSDSWGSNATGLRTFGTFVYRAAREKDYSTAVFNYRHMVQQCNGCHREFAAGEPHVEP